MSNTKYMRQTAGAAWCVGRALLLATAAAMVPLSASQAKAPPKLVGAAYATWFGPYAHNANTTWDIPQTGAYMSASSTAIDQHMAQLIDAGVDFAWIDWSNNINCQPAPLGCPAVPNIALIESNTAAVFNRVATLKAGGNPVPKLAIFLGIATASDLTTVGGQNKLQNKFNQVYNTFIANATYNDLYQYWDGKPLVVVYVNTPAVVSTPPAFTDPRFTIRWMAGLIDDQPALVDVAGTGQSKFWSYKDRNKTVAGTGVVSPTFSTTSAAGSMLIPEHVAVTASYPNPSGGWTNRNGVTAGSGCPSGGTPTGATTTTQWLRVANVDPQIVTVASFNEWVKNADQQSPDCSIDFEPSSTLGNAYLQLTKAKIAEFKRYRSDLVLRETTTGRFFFKNNPDFYFQTDYLWSGAAGGTRVPFTGDFNNDGYGDIGLRDPATGTFSWRLGPTFAAAPGTFTWAAGTNYQPFAGDFNGDGYWDIGMRDANTGVFFWRLGPNFATNQSSYTWTGTAGANYQPYAGDFNGDGVWDIGMRDANTGVFFWRLGPNFATNQSSFTWVAGANYVPITGDFNGDGLWDIGMRDLNNGIIYWRLGPNFATNQSSYAWAGTAGANYQALTIDLR
jgi:hypothetical protein